MKKIPLLAILLLSKIFAYGQTDAGVRRLFYDLPLDRSGAAIIKAIKSDERFKSTNSDSSDIYVLMPSYSGVCSDSGIIRSKPDSIEIEMTWVRV